MLPIRKSNLLADAIHGGTGGNGGGSGLDPFARLHGQLNRQDHGKVFDVRTEGLGQHNPLYLVERTLDTYNDSGPDAGWQEGPPGSSEPLGPTSFGVDPAPEHSSIKTFPYKATLTIRTDDEAVPLFQSPTEVQGLSGSWSWSRQNSDLLGGRLRSGTTYTESVAEPQPTQQQLAQSGLAVGPATQRWLQHPNLPATVVTLVNTLTNNKTLAPYARARAILNFFGPDHGFTYNLQTKKGDSGSDLVDFLQNRTGYCQQYAAAMAIMLRLADVPARVEIGYTHQAPKQDGTFTITNDDAHAWVEAYFAGIGWLPFDPTPLSDTGRAATIPWAPKPTSTLPGGPATRTSLARRPTTSENRGSDAGGGNVSQATGDSGAGTWVGWLIAGIAALIVLVGLLPGGVRLWRRRRRLRAAARDPDPLWQELADTAVDLGYVWSPVRTPRQVVTWLRREGVRGPAEGSLQTLAGAVERSRYAAPQAGVSTQELVRELRRVEVSLRSTRTRWDRIRARVLPPSLGWSRSRRH
jgi:transglutaminase-like putative cysteine protease